jgi:hypothetical protein
MKDVWIYSVVASLWPQREGKREGKGARGGMGPYCLSSPSSPSPMSPPASGMLPRFRLSITPAPVATDPSAPLQQCLDLGLGRQACASRDQSTPEREDGQPPDSADTPATSREVGSFTHDRESGIYSLQWESMSEFHVWRQAEERAHSIELIASSTVSGGRLWLQKRVYVCARQLSGGPNKYKKKYNRFRKIGTKKTGCRCRVIIKRYHHTPIVLGRYFNAHDHDLGLGNVAYMRLSRAARETINSMLIQQVDRRVIVRNYLNII